MAKVKFYYGGELPAYHWFQNPVTGERESFEIKPEFELDADSPAGDRAYALVELGLLSETAPKKAKEAS